MAKPSTWWSEDWLSVWVGLLVFLVSLLTLAGVDALGWAVTTRVWTDLSTALAPVSKNYSGLGGFAALVATFIALLVVMTVGVAAGGANARRFAIGFVFVFWISYACWIIGSYASVAVNTPADMQKFGISWSLRLTPEGGFVVALLAGLIVGNFLPGFAKWIGEAVKPELYIKTAIVILGGFLAITAADKLGLATSLLIRGIAAIVEAYLIFWAVVYFVARKWFGFSREFAAPLASGISICGVSAAIATGGAIRARPAIPIMVSSLVVIFAVVELLLLPFLADIFLSSQPMVAGAWMGLAVKTDGAAVASGAITEALIVTRAAGEGVRYQPGWILGTAAAVKVFIDVFIGIWALILAYIWTNHIDRRPGERARVGELWTRFPKFILGYVLTFVVAIVLALSAAPQVVGNLRLAMGEANTLRGIFFVLTFFSIGVNSNFRKLWEEGIGKLAAVYLACLFGFVLWVSLIIAWVFFAGVKPPLMS